MSKRKFAALLLALAVCASMAGAEVPSSWPPEERPQTPVQKRLTTSEEPAEPTEEPAEPTEEPTEPTEEPAEPTEEPAEPTEEPAEPTEEPAEPTEEPAEPTEEPAEPTEEPTEPTEEPAEPTEEPAEPTEEPPEPTEEPAEPTEEPPEPTKGEDDVPEAERFTLSDLLAVLPLGADGLLDAAAVEGAPEFEPFWRELSALVGEELDAAEGATEEDGAAVLEKTEVPESANEEENPLADLTGEARSYFALRLLAFAQDNGLLAASDAASKCIGALAASLAAEHSPYSHAERAVLNAVSARFAASGKLAAGVAADRVLARGGNLRLQYAPIAYNGRVLLAVEDIADYLGGAAVLQETGDGLAVQAGALLVELERGSAAAYVNDVPAVLPAPVLVFEGQVYAPAELLELREGRSGMSFSEPVCFILS